MKRVAKTFYQDDEGHSLLSLAQGKAYIERGYHGYSADELDELATACRAAAEELRTLEQRAANEAHAELAS